VHDIRLEIAMIQYRTNPTDKSEKIIWNSNAENLLSWPAEYRSMAANAGTAVNINPNPHRPASLTPWI
jgi:hypothetical protein